MNWLKRKPVAFIVLALALILGTISSAQGQGGGLGNIETYDPSNKWVLFTDHTGTWHAPLAIHNSAAPSTSITEFTVNTDDQFQIQTYHESQISALLDLDTDGSAALFGAAGGGIGVEAATGDTCIPTSLSVACAPQALRVGASGILTQYRGQTLDGNGMSAILYHADANLTGSFGAFTIFTTKESGYAAGGMYRLSGYITALNTVEGSIMQFTLGYTDETGPQVQFNGTGSPFNQVGRYVPFTYVFYAQPNSPITITTVTSIGQNYTVHLRLEAL